MIDDEESDTLEHFYYPVKLIQEGSFGKVYECRDLDQPLGEPFAVKVINKKAVKQHKIESLRNEAKILETIKHQNIIGFLGILEGRDFIYIKMELARGGTLGDLLRQRARNKDPLTPNQVSTIMKSIFCGLSHMHSMNIIHRDLKPDNILLADKDHFDNLKIADFGMCVKLDNRAGRVSSHCGTLLFMAPEMILKKTHSKSIDIWSCAIIMYMLFSEGNHPLVHRSQRGSITSEEYSSLVTKAWPQLPHEVANEFLKKLSALEAIERYNAFDALKHPFLGGEIAPLTYHQSFRGFEVGHHLHQVVRLSFICSKLLEKPTKLTIPRDYLSKVESYNQETFERRMKETALKRDHSRKGTSDQDIRKMFSQMSNQDSSTIDQCYSPLFKKTKFAEFINLEEKKAFTQTMPLKQGSSLQKGYNLFHISKPKKSIQLTSSRQHLFDTANSVSPKKMSRISNPNMIHPTIEVKKATKSIDKLEAKERYGSTGFKRRASINKCPKEFTIQPLKS